MPFRVHYITLPHPDFFHYRAASVFGGQAADLVAWREEFRCEELLPIVSSEGFELYLASEISSESAPAAASTVEETEILRRFLLGNNLIAGDSKLAFEQDHGKDAAARFF